RVEVRFGKVRGPESFKENHLRRPGLQAEWALYRQQASEVGLKGKEQGERLKRIHMAEVPTERECVLAVLPGNVVHNLRAALLVEIRVAPVHAGGKSVQNFQMGLSGNRGKVERTVAVLQAQFIHKVRSEVGRQASYERLIAKIVVLKS